MGQLAIKNFWRRLNTVNNLQVFVLPDKTVTTKITFPFAEIVGKKLEGVTCRSERNHLWSPWEDKWRTSVE